MEGWRKGGGRGESERRECDGGSYGQGYKKPEYVVVMHAVRGLLFSKSVLAGLVSVSSLAYDLRGFPCRPKASVGGSSADSAATATSPLSIWSVVSCR